MIRIGIITADRARARFVTADLLDDPGFDRGPRLAQTVDLENPDERQFAAQIAETAERFISEERPSRLVLVAGPELLGVLRSELSAHAPNLALEEVAEEPMPRSLSQLWVALTRRGVLPEPPRPRRFVDRPRGPLPSMR